MLAQRRGSGKVLVQPERDSLEAMADLVLLFAVGQDREEEFGAVAVDFHVAELVDVEDVEQVDAAVVGDGLGQLFSSAASASSFASFVARTYLTR